MENTPKQSNPVTWHSILASSEHSIPCLFMKCPICYSSLITLKCSGSQIDTSCSCNFQIENDSLTRIIQLGEDINLLKKIKIDIKIGALRNGEVARFEDGRICANKKYLDSINELNIGFDRVLFWLFVLAHETQHAELALAFNMVEMKMKKAMFETKNSLSVYSDHLHWIPRETKIMKRHFRVMRMSQESIIQRNLAKRVSKEYPIVYKAFLRVFKRLQPSMTVPLYHVIETNSNRMKEH